MPETNKIEPSENCSEQLPKYSPYILGIYSGLFLSFPSYIISAGIQHSNYELAWAFGRATDSQFTRFSLGFTAFLLIFSTHSSILALTENDSARKERDLNIAQGLGVTTGLSAYYGAKTVFKNYDTGATNYNKATKLGGIKATLFSAAATALYVKYCEMKEEQSREPDLQSSITTPRP